MELLRDRSPELEALGARAFGISRDSPWSHVAWEQALDLNVPLLSDWNAEATHGFGIGLERVGLGADGGDLVAVGKALGQGLRHGRLTIAQAIGPFSGVRLLRTTPNPSAS